MVQYSGLIGAFHKTGTVLIRSVLEAAHREGVIHLWQADGEREPDHWDICFAEHSHFPEQALRRPHRGAIVIRDPRDVIISGAHYHCRADEPWLNTPEARFGGRTYREMISSLATDDDRFSFEMEQAGGETIRHMLEVVTSDTSLLIVKYETLVTDVDLRAFDCLFEHLGVSAIDRPHLLRMAHDNSLFGGVESTHIRNGSPEQWKTVFSPLMRERFARRFDDITVRLGYEPTLARVA